MGPVTSVIFSVYPVVLYCQIAYNCDSRSKPNHDIGGNGNMCSSVPSVQLNADGIRLAVMRVRPNRLNGIMEHVLHNDLYVISYGTALWRRSTTLSVQRQLARWQCSFINKTATSAASRPVIAECQKCTHCVNYRTEQ